MPEISSMREQYKELLKKFNAGKLKDEKGKLFTDLRIASTWMANKVYGKGVWGVKKPKYSDYFF